MTNTIPVRFSPRPVRTFGGRYFAALAVVAIVLTAAIINIVLSDYVVTWDGVVPVAELSEPVVGDCGDYCGSDAGLITTPAN